MLIVGHGPEQPQHTCSQLVISSYVKQQNPRISVRLQRSPLKPTLVVSPHGSVSGQNEPARELLGHGEGNLCWDVVGGLTTRRDAVCVPGCATKLCTDPDGVVDHGEVMVRGQRVRMVCHTVGDNVVVQMSPSVSRLMSPREREVLALVAQGNNNSEVAHALGIGEGTVRTHMENLRGKLNARTRAQAVAIAMIRGEI